MQLSYWYCQWIAVLFEWNNHVFVLWQKTGPLKRQCLIYIVVSAVAMGVIAFEFYLILASHYNMPEYCFLKPHCCIWPPPSPQMMYNKLEISASCVILFIRCRITYLLRCCAIHNRTMLPEIIPFDILSEESINKWENCIYFLCHL